MTALVALWELSLLLCGMALLAVIALIVARLLGDRRARRVAAERRALASAFIGAAPLPGGRSRLTQRIAADLVLELAELVRGSDRDALLAAAADAGAVEELTRRLRAGSAQERLMAAEGLSLFPGGAADNVVAALDDRNSSVRLGAALALAQHGRAPCAVELVAKLGLGRGERSRLSVALLRDVLNAAPGEARLLLLDRELPDSVQAAVVEAIAANGLVEHVSLIAELAERAERRGVPQPQLYRALGRLGAPAGHRAILAGLASADADARAAAARAAGEARLVAATPDLKGLLGDPAWWPRFRAGEALVQLGSTGLNALREAANNAPEPARSAASACMAEWRLA